MRNLARAVRDGPGMSLAAAVKELSEIADPQRVQAAADRINAISKYVQNAHAPRAVVAGNIETWYFGPRTEDKNWPSLEAILRAERLPDEAMTDLDESSTKIVAHLPNPRAAGDFHCRGLVLGYVQSGKTTNFTAVIAKAADAGYRFFIVLSGIHDALRQQTQDRLNEQLWAPHPELWNRLTNETDFRPTDNVDALLSTSNQRVLVIVKKNGPRLKALRDWLMGAQKGLLANCPILIIDDEADQASVNTAKTDGEPTKINGLIRDIVNGSPKAAYVGYTATPFANVLIDPQDEEDLFPRDFIVDLPRPKVYIGPEAIFGREPLDFDPDGESDDGNDFVRSVPLDELTGLRPAGAKNRHQFDAQITSSLGEALRYFLMSTAARRVRKSGNPHATALIHTSQHIDVHERTADAIRAYVGTVATKLARRDESLLNKFADQWHEECERVPSGEFDLEQVPWNDVAAILPSVAAAAHVITDNSRSQERLRFDANNPRIIIAVGGNTLSRGLTLEGLAVSFFVRTASAYDTLLQMGRWFGYRNGYADLTRIWMTDEMREWFHHLATVEQEIRFDIERYETDHVTPAELGPRIRTHPKLAITAASKMQKARRADASYSGRRLQTILFNHLDDEWLEQNIRAARELVSATASAPRRSDRAGVTIIGPIETAKVIDFLGTYRFHENSRDLDRDLIVKYLEGRGDEGELTTFNIAVMGHPKTGALGTLDLGLETPVNCINRARIRVIGGSTYADIKALMSKTDRIVDLGLAGDAMTDLSAGEIAKLRNLPSRGGQGDGSGLLLLYPVSKESVPTKRSEATREALHAKHHVLGVGLVFPESSSAKAKVEYVTSNVAALAHDIEEPDEQDALNEPEVLAT